MSKKNCPDDKITTNRKTFNGSRIRRTISLDYRA